MNGFFALNHTSEVIYQPRFWSSLFLFLHKLWLKLKYCISPPLKITESFVNFKKQEEIIAKLFEKKSNRYRAKEFLFFSIITRRVFFSIFQLLNSFFFLFIGGEGFQWRKKGFLQQIYFAVQSKKRNPFAVGEEVRHHYQRFGPSYLGNGGRDQGTHFFPPMHWPFCFTYICYEKLDIYEQTVVNRG